MFPKRIQPLVKKGERELKFILNNFDKINSILNEYKSLFWEKQKSFSKSLNKLVQLTILIE